MGDIEQIGALLNRRVLVLGKAVYRPSGRLLRVEAEEVILTSGHEKFFSTIPNPGDFDHLNPTHLTRIRIDEKTGKPLP